MAQAAEAALGDLPAWQGGLVIVKDPPPAPGPATIELVQAGHPLPDARGVAAAQRIGALARAAGPHDLVLALISGGGSALLADPAPRSHPGRDQARYRAATARRGDHRRNQHRAQAPGRGSRAAAGRGRRPRHGGRADPQRCRRQPARRDRLRPHRARPHHLRRRLGRAGPLRAGGPPAAAPARTAWTPARPATIAETPKPGDPRSTGSSTLIVGDNRQAAAGRCGAARAPGPPRALLSTYVEGEAREVGRVLAGLAQGAGTPATTRCPARPAWSRAARRP